MYARISYYLQTIEWRWSLILQAAGLMASFVIPAWAVDAAKIFEQYSPFSWVVAGFGGMFFASLTYLLTMLAYRVWVRSRFDARFLQRHPALNPMDIMFENQRIHLNDFVLPSHPTVENKMFFNCEIVGPANIWFVAGNNADQSRGPNVDAVFLGLGQRPPANCFAFFGCTFRQCSFQRITVFLGAQDYPAHAKNSWMNWISLTPDSVRSPSLLEAMPPSDQRGVTSDSQSQSSTEEKTRP